MAAAQLLQIITHHPTYACVQVDGPPPAFIAALQDALLYDVPCLGVHTVHIDTAPRRVHGDALALSLGLVPLQCTDLQPGAAQDAAAAVGVFAVDGSGTRGATLCAGDIVWQPRTPSACRAVYPEVRVATVPPGERLAGHVIAAWGTGRNGLPWKPVSAVWWEAWAFMSWRVAPGDLTPDQRAALRDAMPSAEGFDAACAHPVGEPFEVVVAAGMRELLASEEAWGALFEYVVPDCPRTWVHLETNGQVSALQALHHALAAMHTDLGVVHAALLA
jgi:hypothetical protein